MTIIKPMISVAREAEALTTVPLPGALNYHNAIEAGLSPGMAAAKAVMEGWLNRAEGINARRQTADPDKTYGRNLREVEAEVDKFNSEYHGAFEQARTKLLQSTANAEKAYDDAVGIKSTPQDAAIAGALRGLSPKDRDTSVRAVFADGDKVAIAAIVNAHPIVTGVDATVTATLLDEFKKATAPMQHEALAKHKQALGWLDNCGPSLMKFGAKAYLGLESYAKKRQAAVSVLASYGIAFED